MFWYAIFNEPERICAEDTRIWKKYGISEQEIIRVLKENMQQNRQPLRKITDDFGNTVLHMSCEKGDIGTTKIILEALDDDETKALLIQHNQYVHLHSHQDTALTLATHSKNYDVALFLMRYIEKRFGRDFTKKMILECNYYRSNAANTSFTLENVDLVRSILGYLKDQDFKTVMETKNQFETSLLDQSPKNRFLPYCNSDTRLFDLSRAVWHEQQGSTKVNFQMPMGILCRRSCQSKRRTSGQGITNFCLMSFK